MRIGRFRIIGLLASAAILYFFANVQRTAIPGAIFDQLQESLSASASGVAAFGSSFMYLYAAGQLLIGFMADKFGTFRMIGTGAVLFCLGSLLFPLSGTLSVMYAARILTGLGASAFYLCIVRECLRIFRFKSHIAVALVILTGYAGGIAANAPLSAAVDVLGWRSVLAWTAILSLAAAVCFFFFGWKLPRPRIGNVSLRPERFLEVLRMPCNRILFIFSGLNWGIYYVVQTVAGKKFLQDFSGLSSSRASWILSLMGVFSAVSGFLFSMIAGRSNVRRIFLCRISGAVCLCVTAMTAFCIFFFPGTAFPAFLFCVLAMTASLSAILIPILHEMNPPELRTSAIGCMNFFFYVSVAVFGNLTGCLMNLFPAERRGNVLVCSRFSYLAVFLLLFLFAVPVFLFSRKLRVPEVPVKKS